MSSTYPTTLDSLTDPTATSKLNSPSHSQQHININDAVEKIEAKVGVDSSAVTTTHAYKLSGVTGTDVATSLTGAETLTTKTLTTPVIASFYQDAGKTKLMTTPNTASDTLVTLAAEQTLTTKTLTTPVVASFYQDAAKAKLMTTPDTASDTLAAIAATQTLTNKRITKRVDTSASAVSHAINTDSYDDYTITAQAEAVTIAAPTGTPTSGQTLVIRILDNGTARAITWNAAFVAIGVTLPTTTVASKYIYVGCKWNSTSSKWDVLAVQNQV